MIWFPDILLNIKSSLIKGKGSKHVDKFRNREIACYKNDLRKKWFEIKYVSCYTKSSIHTISPAIKPALVSAGTESASSCGTHMGAFLILPLPLKDLTGNEETEGDLGWISLMTGEGNNQLNASVFTDPCFTSLPSSWNSRF